MRTTKLRLAAAATAALLLGGCVQFGTGRGQPFPDAEQGTDEEFEGESEVDETGDDPGVEAEEVESRDEES